MTEFYKKFPEKDFNKLRQDHPTDYEMYEELYLEWKRNEPNYTLRFALQIFPEAREYAFLQEIKNLKKRKSFLIQWNGAWQKLHMEHPPENDNERFFFEVRRESAEQEIDSCTKRIRSYRMSLDFLQGKRTATGGITEEMIAQARAVPIDTLMEFRNGKAKCLWHEDSHPSLHYYRTQNKVKCFSCGELPKDAIDVVMKVEGISFLEAIRRLIQL